MVIISTEFLRHVVSSLAALLAGQIVSIVFH